MSLWNVSESAVVEFIEKTGDFQVYTVRSCRRSLDSRLEISLKDFAFQLSALRAFWWTRFVLKSQSMNFGRAAAQSAKQTIMGKMRNTYNDWG